MTLKQVILCPCASDKQGEVRVPPPCSMGYIYIYLFIYIFYKSNILLSFFFPSFSQPDVEKTIMISLSKQASSR